MTGAAPRINLAPPLDAIPAELRQLAQWIGWRAVRREGRLTKEPRRCNGTGRAAVDNPAAWSTFEAAVAAVERGAADGIGRVFTATDPYTGVDLDDCVVDGRLHPAAAAVVERLASYTERSPSGSGVHAIVRASLPAGSRHRTSATGWAGKLEIYDRRRFFTMTGWRLAGTTPTIEPRQAEIDELVAELLPGPAPAAVASPAAVVSLADAELLERARRARNGARFRALYDAGDPGGYSTRSEADAALCGHLAFWTAGDVERIDRLFRASALMRGKWGEARGDSTYGRRTIEYAVRNCPAFYTPPGEARRQAVADAVREVREERRG